MVPFFTSYLADSEKGVTLVEMAVVIFIIALFSAIAISNFPEIERQYALSRAAYALDQDLSKVQDMGLSGVLIKDSNAEDNSIPDDGNQLVVAEGYGIYMDARTSPDKQYIIYADTCPAIPDYQYTPSDSSCTEYGGHDYVVEKVNVDSGNSGVYIKAINSVDPSGAVHSINYTSVNVTPPNPYINIENLGSPQDTLQIVLGLQADPSSTRTVSMNISGLITIK